MVTSVSLINTFCPCGQATWEARLSENWLEGKESEQGELCSQTLPSPWQGYACRWVSTGSTAGVHVVTLPPWHRDFLRLCFHGWPTLSDFFFFNLFWLRWVLVAVRGLSLVAASGGYSSLWCAGFSLRWLLLLWSTGSRCTGFSSCGTRAQ